ncbi:hypothetical protein [Streptomyces sp. NPDC017949]|nr:hypothetical protein [Streptomyces sp. DK15]
MRDLIAAAEHELVLAEAKVVEHKADLRRLRRRERCGRRRILRRKALLVGRPAVGVALAACGVVAFVLGIISALTGGNAMDNWFAIALAAWTAAAAVRPAR